MRFLSAFLFSLFILSTSASFVLAAELTDLYQAEVDANQSQSAWQQAAFAAVLLKLTGSDAIMANSQVQAELKQAGNYVKQYQMVQRDGRNLLVVSLDQQKITALLAQQQVPVWGSRRPDVLVWLTEKTLAEPKFVLENQHPLRTNLMQQAKKYGLSFIYPLYDVDDLALLNESSVWAGDWAALGTASIRYKAERVQNLLVEQLQDATGQLQYRLIRQQQQDGQLQQQEFTAADIPSLMAQFSAALASELSAQYAVNLHQQNTVTAEGQLQLTIAGVTSLTDLVQVQKIFASMLTVRQHQLVSFSQQQAVIALQLTATEADFYRALALEKKLQPEQAPAAIQPNNEALQRPATEPGADEAANNSASTLTAAEQAMEQALGAEEPTAATTESVAELQIQEQQTNSGTVANSGTTTAVISTFYRYIKP
ncbi:DUF2066 domain-containing protein [Rheinheimera sp.]|uniref:DUF2066 domain-containing protein n=1 Tax=Rheinheimera sp. TaxID=1869214 RepID=UPI0027B92D5D|nr:DUF2066 domain-containing protein [Rheinheimera sp.]